MSEADDDEARWASWMTRAQTGDQAAYGELLGELSPVIRAYLLVRFGRLESLDDCVQETLIAVHQARHTYDPGRPFRAWLFAIIRNRAIDSLRKSARRVRREEAGGAVATPAETVEPSVMMDTGKLLGELSDSLRETLIMTKILGYSIRETAERQGVSESVVKVRVHRGLRKLQALCELEA